jgi:hypothetical protein
MSEPRPTYATRKDGTPADRRETSDKSAVTYQIDQLIARIESQAVEIDRGITARVQLAESLAAQHAAADNIEQQRRAAVEMFLAEEREHMITRKERDQLRATIAEQAQEIERLKNQKVTIGGVDIPVKLDPTMKPDEWHIRYPMASSYPPPKMDPEPMQDYRVTTIEGDQYKAHCSIFPKYPTWRENENGHEIDRVIAWTKI